MRAGKLAHAIHVVCATALLALAGCQPVDQDAGWVSVTPESMQGDVSLYRDVRFDDIPIPPEYVLIPERSYSFQGALFRNGFFLYQGRLEWTQALDFFRTQLPAVGWIPGEVERGFDFRVMPFRKGEEQLIVVVRQLQGGSQAEMQIDNVQKNDLLLKGKLPTSKWK